MVGSLEEVADRVHRLQFTGKKVVFTNGCFDILHSGHIDLLQKARELGDALVVGINSDASVARLKGPTRPIISQSGSAELRDGLEIVSFVCSLTGENPLNAIRKIRPDVR